VRYRYYVVMFSDICDIFAFVFFVCPSVPRYWLVLYFCRCGKIICHVITV